MNPFDSFSPPFRKGRNSVSAGNHAAGRLSRRYTKNRVYRKAKLRDGYGTIHNKHLLKLSLLNVDGLCPQTLMDVKETLRIKQVDMCVLLETKRRFDPKDSYDSDEIEIQHDSIEIEGYEVKEYNRSDSAGDKKGGGICIYTRNSSAVSFNEYDPPITDPDLLFVKNERVWKITESARGKTAVCAVYAGFQAEDDRHASWNTNLFSVIQSEILDLRKKGYRIVLLGDFNGHVGNTNGIGVPGNNPRINRNGHRFIKFLDSSYCSHVNGMSNLTTGLWTRQRNGISSVIDYAVIGKESIDSVSSMTVDDKGTFGANSDHNWIFLDLHDTFVSKVKPPCKPRLNSKYNWKIQSQTNWSKFKDSVSTMLEGVSLDSDGSTMARKAVDILHHAGLADVGLHNVNAKSKTSMASQSLPWHIVTELNLKRKMEANWKLKCSTFSSLPEAAKTDQLRKELQAAEETFLEQKQKVSDLFFCP